VEIQRLIGRSLRQAVNLWVLGEKQITLDCDVLNADGGTRCASITGAWIALSLALRKFDLSHALVRQLTAVSIGILDGAKEVAWTGRSGLILDLEYEEDHRAAVDCNLVAAMPMDGEDLEIVEFQSTGEGRSFLRDEALSILDLGLLGCQHLLAAQSEALG
jgi:ribonuclease PH